MVQAPRPLTESALPAASFDRVSLPFLRVQERRLLLATVDGFLSFLVLLGAYEIWRASVHPAADNMAAVPWAWVLGGVTVWLMLSWLAGSYELVVADRLSSSLRSTFIVAVFSLVCALAANYAFVKTYPRPSLALVLVGVPATIVGWRTLYSLLLHRPVGATRILFLGAGDDYEILQAAKGGSKYYRFVGFVSPSETDPKAVGTASELSRILDEQRVHRLVIAGRLVLSDAVMASVTAAIERGIEVLDFNSAYEEIAGKVAVEYAGDHWLTALPTRPQTSTIEEIVIRLLDVLGGVVGLILTIALFPFIAGAVALTSKGSVLYAQERLGRGGKPFTMHKFRSMRVDAEDDGACWAQEKDVRATGIGGFLRRTHLDELPQFWNILRGDMSLVGPRPERAEFTESLSSAIPFYRLRLSVRPGLTGLKQIKVGYAASPVEHLEVLRHDLYYIKHRSLALNCLIMARTLGSVFGSNGR